MTYPARQRLREQSAPRTPVRYEVAAASCARVRGSKL